MNKQIPVWKWRDGEISYKDFLTLKYQEKQNHLEKLYEIPDDELSNNDIIILNIYSKRKIKKFFTLED